MKKILFLILLHLSVAFYAQNHVVEYQGIQKIFPTEDISDPNLKKMFEDANKELLLFSLTFNENKSAFIWTNEDSETDKKMSNALHVASFGYKPNFYFKDKNLFYYVHSDVIASEEIIYNWQISTESKVIDGYNCFKATYEEKFTNRLNKEVTIIVTAWFCPELPFSYGPLNYNGLPGLILELERNGNKIVAKKITLVKNTTPITLPKLKIVTQEQYLKKLLNGLPY